MHPSGWAIVERPDARIWYHETPSDGPVVVLLHGLAGHALEWSTTIDALAGRFTVVSIEQRGHGSSTQRPDDVSRQAYVDDVVAVLDDLSAEQVDLVGQSMGAHTAMLVAARHPERISRLVLVEGGLGGEGAEGARAVREWLARWPAPFEDREDFVQFFGGNPVVAQAWADGLEERSDGLWPRWDADVLGTALADVAAEEYADDWTAIEAPTMLVRGENSMIPGDQYDRMLVARPGTRITTINGAGHDVHLERPVAWLRTLKGFLDS